MRSRIAAALTVASLLASIGLAVGGLDPIATVAIWTLITISTLYATEVAIALYGITLYYNVLVVSVLAALPQSLMAARLAAEGHAYAAWLDTILSTVVDAVFATALVRRDVVGSPMVRAFLPNMACRSWRPSR